MSVLSTTVLSTYHSCILIFVEGTKDTQELIYAYTYTYVT